MLRQVKIAGDFWYWLPSENDGYGNMTSQVARHPAGFRGASRPSGVGGDPARQPPGRRRYGESIALQYGKIAEDV